MPRRKENIQITAQSPLVAIDFGSNCVRAMAAQRLGPDTLQILGYEEKERDCVDRGIITQSADAAYAINEVLLLLANRIHVKNLPSAFVTIGGKQMKADFDTGEKDFLRPRLMSDAHLKEVEEEFRANHEKKNPNIAIIDLFPAYYVLDGKEQDSKPSPTQKAEKVNIAYTILVAPKETHTRLIDSFNKSSKIMEKYFVRMDALLSAFGAEDSSVLENGCAVIDFGAQTTSLCVYKGNQFLSMKVVAKGGWDITQKIASLGISMNNAEEIKCKFGWALPVLIDKHVTMRIPNTTTGEKISIDSTQLAEIIHQQLEEITTPIWEELNKHESRIKTLFVTGGGCMLNGLPEYIESKTSLDVMAGSHAILLARDTDEEFYKPQYSPLVGTLIMGADYRDTHAEDYVKGTKKKELPGIFQMAYKTLFDNNDKSE